MQCRPAARRTDHVRGTPAVRAGHGPDRRPPLRGDVRHSLRGHRPQLSRRAAVPGRPYRGLGNAGHCGRQRIPGCRMAGRRHGSGAALLNLVPPRRLAGGPHAGMAGPAASLGRPPRTHGVDAGARDPGSAGPRFGQACPFAGGGVVGPHAVPTAVLGPHARGAGRQRSARGGSDGCICRRQHGLAGPWAMALVTLAPTRALGLGHPARESGARRAVCLGAVDRGDTPGSDLVHHAVKRITQR